MKKSVFAVLSMLFSLQLWAQSNTQIVTFTDIDDTLKVAHILSPVAAVANAPRVDNVFRGMPALIQALKTRIPKMPVIYLSNAPVEIMGYFHTQFLLQNQFPEGNLILRRELPASDHKLVKMREILNNLKPRYVIALGDNGEKDVLIYDQIRKEFPQTTFFIYIRQVYFSKRETKDSVIGQPVLPGQMGFVTPVEVAMDMALKNILMLPQVQSLMDQVVPTLLNSAGFEDGRGHGGELSFPIWQDCRDFVWPTSLDQVRWGRDGMINALKTRIQRRCAIKPQDD